MDGRHPATARIFDDYAADSWNRTTQAVLKVVRALCTWQRRANERQRLARMNHHDLLDMGITRIQANSEAARPFWQP